MDGGADSLQRIEAKIDTISQSVQKIRRHFQITMWITVIFFVAPLVLLSFVIPFFLNSYLGSFEAAGVPLDSQTQSQLDLLKDLLR